MKNLYLYTTTCCYLCDQAELLLRSVGASTVFECEVVDIAESNVLIERYGARIPVLQDQQTLEEIGWPFSKEQLIGWLNKYPIMYKS